MLGQRRYPRPQGLGDIRRKACLWCQTGDLAVDMVCHEFYCTTCGWREWEMTREERLHHKPPRVYTHMGANPLPKGKDTDYEKKKRRKLERTIRESSGDINATLHIADYVWEPH